MVLGLRLTYKNINPFQKPASCAVFESSRIHGGHYIETPAPNTRIKFICIRLSYYYTVSDGVSASFSTCHQCRPRLEHDGQPEEKAARYVGRVAETVGFFHLMNHGVLGKLLAEMLASVRRFNEASTEFKRPYYMCDPSDGSGSTPTSTCSSRLQHQHVPVGGGQLARHPLLQRGTLGARSH